MSVSEREYADIEFESENEEIVEEFPKKSSHRIKGKTYMINNKQRYWDGHNLLCEHKRKQSRCPDCFTHPHNFCSTCKIVCIYRKNRDERLGTLCLQCYKKSEDGVKEDDDRNEKNRLYMIQYMKERRKDPKFRAKEFAYQEDWCAKNECTRDEMWEEIDDFKQKKKCFPKN